ncbi:MAG: phospholipase D-like domain-containing protein, partial [Candidatus Thorarchaeota archaeon]
PYDNITHGIGSPLSYTQHGSTYPRPFSTSGHFNGTMKVIPVFSPVTSLDGILYVINSAQATLDIQIPYFTNVGGTGAVKQVVDAIIAAKNRGVTVRVITEEEKDFELIAEILHSHKIPIVWQDTRWFTANHNKGIIADGQIVLICSINFSDGSISSNREAGVIIEHQGVAGWYQEVYDYDWGIGDCDVQDSVNLYWSPNIPTSSDPIQITVYGHMLYPSITQVTIDYRINDGAWVNGTDITANVVNSAEGDPENYVFTLPAQPDKTNITVVAHIVAAGVTHTSHPMVIPVRNELGRPTVPVDPLMGYGWIIALVVAIVVGLIGGPRVYKRKLSSTRVTSSTRLGEVMSPTRPSESMSSAGPSGGSPPTESRRSTSTKSTRRKSSTGPAEGTSSGTGKTRKSRSGSKKT